MTSLLTRRSIQIASAALMTVTAALLLPLLFHLLPVSGGVPLGARLLPIFYAPFLAAVFFGPAAALIAALGAPSLNHFLTGRPAAEMVGPLTLELLLFVGFIVIAKARWPRSPIMAPAAYLLAHVLAGIVLGLPLETLAASLYRALPGVGVLFALNVAVVAVQKRSEGKT